MARTFLMLRDERRAQEPASDLISIMAHSPEGQALSDMEFASNVSLLIVGGNDTTRNSMSATVMSFHDSPKEWAKLKRSEEHTSELQSLMRISYAVFSLKKTIHVNSDTIKHCNK